jgi:phage portal protein BeeE
MFERIGTALATLRAFVGDDRGGGTRSAPGGIAQGAIGYGAGGPMFLDAFKSKRPPQAWELVNSYKNICYACIQLNADAFARVPLKLYARTAPTQKRPRRTTRAVPIARERYLRNQPHLARALGPADAVDEVVEHPFLTALDAPNEFFDGNLLLNLICRQLDVIGSAYLFPERPARGDGTPDPSYATEGMKIWGLQSQYVYPVKGQGSTVLDCYRYFSDTFAADALVRFRHLSLRDPYLSGYSPLHACFEEIGLSDYYLAVVESFLKNDAQMSLVVSSKDPNQPIGEDERDRLERDIQARFGKGRQGKVWVTSGMIDVNPVAYPPTDLSGLELTRWMRMLAANCFGVPMSLLQSEDSNKAVSQEATNQHQYYAIAPRCAIVAAALTRQLARPVDDRLFFCFEDPVHRDEERDAKLFDMKVKNGTLTINEVRAEDGLDPVEWGDEPWFPSTMVQPSKAEERAAADAALKHKALDAKQAPPGGDPAADTAAAGERTATGALAATPLDDAEKDALWKRFHRLLDAHEDELSA